MTKKLEKKRKSFFNKSKKKNLKNNSVNNSLSLNELLSQLIVHHIGYN